MGCVLNDVQVRVRMGRIVRDDPDEKDAVRRPEISVHAVGECHQRAIRWNRVREARRKAAPLQSEPRLVNPALRAGNFPAFFKTGDFSGPPGFLPVGIGKIPFRKIKMNLHETSRR
jgi:hypothetical protein